MNTFQNHFDDPALVQRYTDGPPRFMPGYADMQLMSGLLLAEHAAPDGEILVLGAGGGLELKVFAGLQQQWRFVGVDPSAEMLALAKTTMGGAAERAQWVEGYIDDAPPGPFAGAACLLTLHFLDRAERLRTLQQLRRRLAPGAPFVAAHSSFPQDPEGRQIWLQRYLAFAVTKGADPDQARQARAMVDANLNLLEPEEDAALMREAGFRDVTLFYAAFTWRGWFGFA